MESDASGPGVVHGVKMSDISSPPETRIGEMFRPRRLAKLEPVVVTTAFEVEVVGGNRL